MKYHRQHIKRFPLVQLLSYFGMVPSYMVCNVWKSFYATSLKTGSNAVAPVINLVSPRIHVAGTEC